MSKFGRIQSEFNRLSRAEQSIVARSWNAFVSFVQSVLKTIAAQFTVEKLKEWYDRLVY